MFFFVPLGVDNSTTPDIVVPVSGSSKIKYVGLSIPKKCYTESLVLNFGYIDKAKGHIPIPYNEKSGTYQVLAVDKTDYRWLANLKYKLALGIAQKLSHEISRIGFDEFRPIRDG